MIGTLPLDVVLAFLVALGVGGSLVLALAVGALYGWAQGQRRRVPVRRLPVVPHLGGLLLSLLACGGILLLLWLTDGTEEVGPLSSPCSPAVPHLPRRVAGAGGSEVRVPEALMWLPDDQEPDAGQQPPKDQAVHRKG